MTDTLPAPRLEHLCDLAVTIAAPLEVGHTPAGLRRMIPITGGTVTGPRVNGQPVSPDDVYFRCQPKLKATAPQWAWLSESQLIGASRRAPDGVF